MFELAGGYRERGMAAYSELQQREFDAEPRGYTAVKHQREVRGAGCGCGCVGGVCGWGAVPAGEDRETGGRPGDGNVPTSSCLSWFEGQGGQQGRPGSASSLRLLSKAARPGSVWRHPHQHASLPLLPSSHNPLLAPLQAATGYFDAISEVVTGGESSTGALKGSTEAQQF